MRIIALAFSAPLAKSGVPRQKSAEKPRENGVN
jgi:hypothetical protein